MGKTTGEKIIEARTAKQWTASDFSRRAGVTPSAVLNWEKNGVIPRPHMLRKIAGVLGVSQGHLLGEEAFDSTLPGDDEDRPSLHDVIEQLKDIVYASLGQRPSAISLTFNS